MPRLIKFSCQGCGTKLAVPHEMAGLSDKCPKCGALVTSPTLEQWEAILSKAAAAKQKAQAQVQANPTKPEEKPASPPAPPTPSPAAQSQGWSTTELADALNPKDPSTSQTPEQDKPTPSPGRRQAPVPTVSSLLATSSEPQENTEQDNPFAPVAEKPTDDSRATSAAPDSASESPTLLSRVLSTPTGSDAHSQPQSQPGSMNEAAESEPIKDDEAQTTAPHDESVDPGDPELSETAPTEDAEEDEDAHQKRASLYSSPHAPGLGELLANIHTNQEKSGENMTGGSPRRNSPFIEPAVPTKIRKRKRRLIIIGAVLFVAVDLAMVAAYFRKEIVEFWHTKVAHTVPEQTPPQPAGQSPLENPTPAGQDALFNIPAQIRPEAEPGQKEPEPEAEAQPMPAPDQAASSPAPTPTESSTSSPQSEPPSAVPQAIPITEEQMAQMLKQQAAETDDAASASASLPTPEATAPQMPEPESDSTPSQTAPTPAPTPAPGTTNIASLTVPKLPEMPGLGNTATQAPTTAPAVVPDKPLTNKVPPEAQAAFTVVKNFLNAPDWRSRSKWVTNSTDLMPAMEKDAQEYGDGPIQVGSIFFSEQYKGAGNPYYMFELSGGDLPHRVMAVVEQTSKKQMLVDWETFNEFRRDKLLQFLEKPGSPPAQFRVVLRRKHYFDKDVEDVDKKESFQVMQLNVSYEGNVFVPKSSPLSTTLATKLPWGMDILVIAELVWKKNAQHEWVEIKSIPYYGWRKS